MPRRSGLGSRGSGDLTLAQRIGDYSSPASLGSRFRRARIQPLLDMIAAVAERKGSCTILDIGGTRKYWGIVPTDFLAAHGVSILITNIDDNTGKITRDDGDPVFSYGYADACNLTYGDNEFDIAHSNSVVEHVGTWGDQVKYGQEVRRIAPAYFVQTPNYWFPWEPHFGTPLWQYLPVPWRVRLLMSGKRGFRQQEATIDGAMRSIQSCQLLDMRRFAVLFPDADLVRERFLGFTKSLIAIRRVA
jgi:hypothetical protein